MKACKILKEADLGLAEDGQVMINIELLWQQTRCFKKFAKEFAKTYAHELMHLLLADVLSRKVTALAEEQVIRMILKEEWDREIAAMYC